MESFEEVTARILERFDQPRDSLIAVLQEVQEEFGYLPKEVLRFISKKSGIENSTLSGVASFYAQFRTEKPGKHQIMVCMGTACHVNKAERVADAVHEFLGVDQGKTTPDGLFSYEEVACLGCCSLSPVMMINGVAYGKLDKEKVRKILGDIRKNEGGEAV